MNLNQPAPKLTALATGGLELGDTHFSGYVRRWRKALADAEDSGYVALLDAITLRQAERAGVEAEDWLDARAADSTGVFERAQKLVDQIDADGLGALWDEPHTLGWFYQHFGLTERAASNRAHDKREAKHKSQTTTTRLYTPRWIAQFLADRCFELVDPRHATVCDPAVGGGQMLLAALDELTRRGVGVDEAFAKLHGVDLDPQAVEITFRSLALDGARRIGRRDLPAERRLRKNLHVGDGLFGDELFNQAQFDVVLANPPYMGSRSMPVELKKRVAREFKRFHGDLYTAFIHRCHKLSRSAVGILAQQTVWYLSRFERARSWLLDEADLLEFMHLGPHAFANLSGEKASVVAFVQAKPADGAARTERTRFVDLRAFKSADEKRAAYLHPSATTAASPHIRYESTTAFNALPGRVLAHWLSPRLRGHFKNSRRLGDIADIPGAQNKTGRNREFIKNWREVSPDDLRRAPEIIGEVGSADGRWVFYSKGGPYAPWWGNWQHVIDWSDAARRFYAENPTSNLLDEKWWFKEGICYTDFGGRRFNARWMPPGCLFDMAGPAIFPHDSDSDHLFCLIAVLNSRPVRELLNAMNPSLHYQVRDLRNLPVPEWSADLQTEMARRARRLVHGLRDAATLDSESPRSLVDSPADPDEVADFHEQRPRLENELDRLICEIYEYPQTPEK